MNNQLTREQVLEMAADVDISFNEKTGNSAAVVPKEPGSPDYTAYIINKQGTVTKIDDVGFNYWCVVPTAEQYLSVYERFGDKDYVEALEELGEYPCQEHTTTKV